MIYNMWNTTHKPSAHSNQRHFRCQMDDHS